MFSLASGIYQSYFVPQQLSILLIGEESTGKTTLLERIKVTQTSRKTAVRFKTVLSCPAPKRYKPENMIQEESNNNDESYREESNDNNNDESCRSLEEIPLTPSVNQKPETFQEYNVKPGAKMLPLDKIRPTIGMNLAKVDLCGTNCRIWDVGGKMLDLWERYYDDADAVIYCITAQGNNDTELLEQTRHAISDDVPFLIFLHQMTPCDEEITLEDLLPHYHNNMMELMKGSAKTGEGVREALEWLIPLAKRQQQLRQIPPPMK